MLAFWFPICSIISIRPVFVSTVESPILMSRKRSLYKTPEI